MKALQCTDTFTLTNGVQVPCIGYGTWQTPNDGTTAQGVMDAVRLGYRHIDTAWVYGNEEDVGVGIAKCGVKREELFVTSKHWVTERGYEKTIRAIDTSLQNLKTDYMDLYLIHWPCVQKISENWEEINADTWRGFERAYKDGKIRAIGVSNFQEKHIDSLWAHAEIKPMVNQLEFHPGYTQIENVRAMQERGLLVEAWSPLGSGAVLKDARLVEIAQKYNKSVAQICVRFALQNGILPLLKSVKPEHIKNNADVFDFVLAEEDMQKLFAVEGLGFSTYLPEDAPADALCE